MKHLKLFEGFDDKYYRKIREEEFWDFDISEYVSIEERYIEKLSKLGFSKSKGGSFCNDDVVWVFKTTSLLEDWLNAIPLYIYIYQLEDEWFLVRIYKDNKSSHWKCDQFDGLMRLLKDKEIVK